MARDENPSLTMDDLAILVRETGPAGYWGKGETIAEARKNARNPRYYEVWLVHRNTTVNDAGGICYDEEFPPRSILQVFPKTRKYPIKVKATA